MKMIAVRILVVVVIIAGLAIGYFYTQFTPVKQSEWGVTFSHRHAEYMGFEWKTMFIDIVNDLKPKNMRLMAYWEDLEKEKGKFDFQIVDEMLIEAEKQGIDAILVVGHKQPRWPECHHPAWYNDLPKEEQDAALLNLVEQSVEHYKSFGAIKAWQVENEPLFEFGPLCPKSDRNILAKEVELVRKLDKRPIILTDSGELGRWLPTIKTGQPDIFGSNMYRVVHNPKTGYFRYPLPPAFFKIKAGIAKTFTGMDNIVGIELQAEPWFSQDLHLTDLKTQYGLMNPVIFEEYLTYAEDVGFRENYLWGVEWWYWLAHNQGEWTMWERAKQLFVIGK